MIQYASRQTSQGLVFAARTEQGLCLLQLIEPTGAAASLAEVRERHPEESLIEDEAALADVFAHIEGWMNGSDKTKVALDLRGTAFQQKVWAALRAILPGETATYTELAGRAGNPKAVRAAASACARNPVALFVPCHRIVRQDGGLGGYRWGLEYKRRLLALEGALMPA